MCAIYYEATCTDRNLYTHMALPYDSKLSLKEYWFAGIWKQETIYKMNVKLIGFSQ